MNPDPTHITRSLPHRLVAFVSVTICLSLALGGTLYLRHHREKVAENHKVRNRTLRKLRVDRSPFDSEIRALQVFDDIVAPAQSQWITHDDGPSPSSNSSGLSPEFLAPRVPNSAPAKSVRNNSSESASDTLVRPQSAVQVPEAATAAPDVASSIAGPPVVAVPAVAAATIGAPEASTQAMLIRQAEPPPAPPVQCGSAQCPADEVCCNASCGTCARPGELCSEQVCGMSTLPVSVLCGLSECNVGEICCNASCGTCARSEAECEPSQECVNPVEFPQSVTCGMVTCNTGLVCCNPSCGLCAPYGVPCSQDACD